LVSSFQAIFTFLFSGLPSYKFHRWLPLLIKLFPLFFSTLHFSFHLFHDESRCEPCLQSDISALILVVSSFFKFCWVTLTSLITSTMVRYLTSNRWIIMKVLWNSCTGLESVFLFFSTSTNEANSQFLKEDELLSYPPRSWNPK